MSSRATSAPLSGSHRCRSAHRLAGLPGSGAVARRAPVRILSALRATPVLVLLAAAVPLVAWLIAAPRTPDLAAQVYRVELFRQLGPALWDEHWYAGHDLPGYG